MEHIVENVSHDLSHQKMDLEIYLKTLNKDKETWMEEDVKPAATKNIAKSLVMQELAKVEEIKVGNEDLQNEVTGMLTQMQQGTDLKEIGKQLKNKNYVNALTMEAASRVINRKVFERMKDIATGKFEETAVEAKKTVKTKKVTETAQANETSEKKPAPVKKTKNTTPGEEKPAVAPKNKKAETKA